MAAKNRAADGNGSNGRGSDGKFVKGNAGGPGNPRIRHVSKLVSAARNAVTPQEMEAVIRMLYEKAADGDLEASRLLMERCMGKPAPERAPSAINLGLPDITTTEGALEAIKLVANAFDEGRIDKDEAARLESLIELTRKTIETNELQQQLDELKARLDRE